MKKGVWALLLLNTDIIPDIVLSFPVLIVLYLFAIYLVKLFGGIFCIK